MENEQEKGKPAPEPEKKPLITCGFCGKTFETKLGLKRHLPKCEASPDEEEPVDEKEDEGIRIFDDEEEKTQSSDDDDFECGHCGCKMPRRYKHCPDCGEELIWG